MITSKGSFISMVEFWFQLGQCNSVYICVLVENGSIEKEKDKTIVLKVDKLDVLKATEDLSANYRIYANLRDGQLTFSFLDCF